MNEAAALVIFDLDGTLVDTLADISASMNRALAGMGLEAISEEQYRQHVGAGVRHLVEHAVPDHPDRWDEITTAFRADYSDNLVVESAPYPGVVELLAELEGRGVARAVLSNKPHGMTVRVVRALFPEVAFTDVVGHRPDALRKPDPTTALAIAAAAGVAPARCVFVGDTEIDIQTARAARMLPVGVHWGFRSRHELTSEGARALLDRPIDLLEHLGPAPTS